MEVDEMKRYELRIWFEHGGGCIWSKNKEAENEYGYLVDYKALNLSSIVVEELSLLEDEYATFLDWDNPGAPSLWTKEQKDDFLLRANKVYEKIVEELGMNFQIENEIDKSII
jgi:hypothetical protein